MLNINCSLNRSPCSLVTQCYIEDPGSYRDTASIASLTRKYIIKVKSIKTAAKGSFMGECKWSPIK